MSRMSDLTIEIEELLIKGKMPDEIANILSIPISWVYETENAMTDYHDYGMDAYDAKYELDVNYE